MKMKFRAPTREGWWFVIAALAVGAIAFDAGVNLFFLAFGMMVCLVVAGFALAQIDLAGLRMRRVLPPAVFAGTPYLMGIVLENTKRRLPSFSIEVEDLVEGRPIDKRCYFLKLPAGRSQETAYRHTPVRRGLHRLTGFRLATKFPFGFFPRARLVPDSQELCVYPALLPPPEVVLRGLPVRSGAGGGRGRSREGEFAGLRAFRPGDDPRDIHWRSSARRGLALVREHEDDTARETTVVLDDGPETRARPEAYERAISEAAGLCVELGRRGYAVALRTRDGLVPPAMGPAHTARLLRVLALVP
jgi:uncharacterized protein (DUF58 family)